MGIVPTVPESLSDIVRILFGRNSTSLQNQLKDLDPPMRDIIKDAELILGSDYSSKLVEELEAFGRPIPFPINSTEFLSGFVKTSAQDVNLKHYSIERDFGKGISRRFYGRFYESHYNFVLCYDGEAAASISFGAIGWSMGILVAQIQGVKNKKEILSPLKWERALLNLVVEWAEENDIPEVQVVRSRNQLYWSMREDERWRLRYDITARRSGFFYDEQTEVYRKPLEVSPVTV